MGKDPPSRGAGTRGREAGFSTAQVLGAAITGGASLVVLQTGQRAANFILNQLLLRHVAPEVFGMASISLDLLLNTALFLSREGFRLSLTRVVLVGMSSEHEAFRRFVNLSWFPALLAPIVSLASLIFLLPSSEGSLRQAGLLFALAASLEGLSEPAYLLCQAGLVTSMRAVSEGAAMLVRSALTFLLLVYVLPGGKRSLLAFGLAQVGYSLVLLAVYWGYVAWSVDRKGSPWRLARLSHVLPRPPPASSKTGWLDQQQLKLAWAMTAQSLLKHLLTQGDKIMLSLGQSYYDQGLYALAQNYGSLAARLLFQPLEESARIVFSRLAPSAASSSPSSRGASEQRRRAESEGSEGDSSSSTGGGAEEARSTLALLLGCAVKLVVLVGLLFTCFGFNYTRLLLRLLLPKAWAGNKDDEGGDGVSGAAWILSWYCVYVLWLALNGMTEAFVYALARHSQVASLSVSTGVSFAVFAAVALPLMSLCGTVGLVLANCVGMACRVAYSLRFIYHYFQDGPRLALLPHPLVLLAFAVSLVVTRLSDLRTDVQDLRSAARHVAVGIACVAGVAGSVVLTEKAWLQDVRAIRSLSRGAPLPRAESADSSKKKVQ